MTILLLLGSPVILRGQSASSSYLQTLAGTPASSSPALSVTSTKNDPPGVFYVNEGPWGKLVCFYVFLEAPLSLVEDISLPNSKPRWSFTKAQAAVLPDLFKKAGLAKAFAKTLLNPKGQVLEDDMVHLFPPLEDLEAMTPAMREVIYPELAKHLVNEFHADPVLITTDSIDEWYQSSKLRPDLVAKIRQMSYKRGECIAFSDLAAMMNYARSSSDARLIFKAFTRTRSLMVQLELKQGEANIEELLNYWTTGLKLRRKDIEPVMQSILDTDGAERLGLVHILPALTRKLLYTYPSPNMLRQGILPDCHWTTLNFFSYTPQEYLLDSRLATSEVLEDFKVIKPPYKYGDILFFIDGKNGGAFHSCIYLADDIVYTKNGRTMFTPWVLMKIGDLKKIYLYNDNGHIQGYRHKDASSGSPDRQ